MCDAAYKTENAKNRLKNVKKKFLLITESSTSACDIMPCKFERSVGCD